MEVVPRGKLNFDGAQYFNLCLWLYEIGVVKGEVDAVAIVADALGNDVLVREIGFN